MGTHLVPALGYPDAHAAMDWLEAALGFERALVVEGPDGQVEHAQLVRGDVMVMLHTASDDGFASALTVPSAVGKPTGSLYVIVSSDEEVDAVHARAVDAGADVVLAPEDQPYGGRNTTIRDLEGYLWSFGSYDPWLDQDTTTA